MLNRVAVILSFMIPFLSITEVISSDLQESLLHPGKQVLRHRYGKPSEKSASSLSPGGGSFDSGSGEIDWLAVSDSDGKEDIRQFGDLQQYAVLNGPHSVPLILKKEWQALEKRAREGDQEAQRKLVRDVVWRSEVAHLEAFIEESKKWDIFQFAGEDMMLATYCCKFPVCEKAPLDLEDRVLERAKGGDMDAMFACYRGFKNKVFTKLSLHEAEEWMFKARKAGHGLAVLYKQPFLADKDYYAFLKLAAKNGHARAQYFIAMENSREIGSKEIPLVLTAAGQGDPWAEFAVYKSFAKIGNRDWAHKYLERAADHDQYDALFALANMFLNGLDGYPTIYTTAANLCKRALEVAYIYKRPIWESASTLSWIYRHGSKDWPKNRFLSLKYAMIMVRDREVCYDPNPLDLFEKIPEETLTDIYSDFSEQKGHEEFESLEALLNLIERLSSKPEEYGDVKSVSFPHSFVEIEQYIKSVVFLLGEWKRIITTTPCFVYLMKPYGNGTVYKEWAAIKDPETLAFMRLYLHPMLPGMMNLSTHFTEQEMRVHQFIFENSSIGDSICLSPKVSQRVREEVIGIFEPERLEKPLEEEFIVTDKKPSVQMMLSYLEVLKTAYGDAVTALKHQQEGFNKAKPFMAKTPENLSAVQKIDEVYSRGIIQAEKASAYFAELLKTAKNAWMGLHLANLTYTQVRNNLFIQDPANKLIVHTLGLKALPLEEGEAK